jgi:exosortase/archaeosortase family protein
MTFIRDQLTFHLPSISIHIAKECSGIRSSTALVITGLLAGQLFLRTFTGKSILVLFVIPLTLLKNGIRITTLSILADKVDTAWITHSDLHHNGGIVFFGIILLFLFGIMFAIKKVEDIFQKSISFAPHTAQPEPTVANENSDHDGSPSGKK